MDKNKINFLREIQEKAISRAGTVLSMFLEGKDVVISTKDISVENWNNFTKNYFGKYILIDGEISIENTSDKMFLLVISQDAGVISNLIMGGEERDITELSDLELTAISETFHQMLNSYTGFLSDEYNKKVLIKDINTKKVDISSELPPFDNLDKEFILTKFKFNVENSVNSQMYQILSGKFVNNLMKILLPEPEQKEKVEKPPLIDTKIDIEDLDVVQQTIPAVPDKKELKIKKTIFAPLEPRELPKEIGNIDLIMDVPLNITVELGRAKKSVQEVLELSAGSIIELDKLDGEPVDVFANGRLIAKGEVVVIGETFGVRIIEILSPQERVGKIRS